MSWQPRIGFYSLSGTKSKSTESFINLNGSCPGAVEIEKEMEIEMLGEIRKEKTERQGKIWEIIKWKTRKWKTGITEKQ